MSRVALVLVYNHRYDGNIEVLERLYGGRFRDIYHLVPFYSGNRPNVIPVYGSSYYFQGYVAQGLRHYFREETEHYLFVADDLLLNPVVNEENYAAHLGLGPGACFLPAFYQFHLIDRGFWMHVEKAYRWTVEAPGVEARPHLPSYEEALERFRRNGLDLRPLRFGQVWDLPRTARGWIEKALRDPGLCLSFLGSLVGRKSYFLSYPLVGGYSDLFAVSSDAIREFCQYCGVFAATDLFVEHAIPTALALAAKSITVESELKLRGKALWTAAEMKELDRYAGSLRALVEQFPADRLYLHPVKLSRWRNDL